MNIKEQAKAFAIKAHRGQVRKTEPDKPMIIHPIYVASLLEEYGFDDNVVSAGFLHDVVEDTEYTEEDIKNIFGEDIRSLVMTASEPDKSLTWEERKQHTIETIKNQDLRHKAVVCCDKISNLEDFRNLSEKRGEYDYSSFNRGFEQQKWYYESVYNSLIHEENENLPMFVRLKELIWHIFLQDKKDEFVKEKIFKGKEKEYQELLRIHYKKQELVKLKSIVKNVTPYVIEFTGTPRTGKTTLINNLTDFFKKAGFTVEILEEFTTSEKYKKEVYPSLKDKHKKVVNVEIPQYVFTQLQEVLARKSDIIMIDRSLFDRLIWTDRLFLKEGMTQKEYEDYLNIYIPLIKENIHLVLATFTDSLTALKRDYAAYLSLEPRRFLNVSNVDEYNTSLKNMEALAIEQDIPFYLFDTTDKNQREISMEVADIVLEDMRKIYIKKICDIFQK